MTRKTNKTAHVLKLISKAKEEHKLDDDLEIEPSEGGIANDLSFIDMDVSNDNEVSEKVKEKLSEIVDGTDLANNPVTEQINDTVKDQNKDSVPGKNTLENYTSEAVSGLSENTDSQNNAAAFEESLIENNGNTDTGNTTEAEYEKNSIDKTDNNDIVIPAGKSGNTIQESADIKSEVPKTNITNEKGSENEIKTENDNENILQENTKNKSSNIGYKYVNVMEEVVKSRVDEFINMFDVCKCQRCRVDVIALALNELSPKYIVVDNMQVSPLLNFYINHYKGAVTAQLSRACTVVKNNPHH